jgi:hypothetical protein
VQILELEFLLDIGLEAAAPEPGVEQVASGAARQRAMGAQWPGLPLRHPTHDHGLRTRRRAGHAQRPKALFKVSYRSPYLIYS